MAFRRGCAKRCELPSIEARAIPIRSFRLKRVIFRQHRPACRFWIEADKGSAMKRADRFERAPRIVLIDRLRRQICDARARGVPDQMGFIGLSIADLDALLKLAEGKVLDGAP